MEKGLRWGIVLGVGCSRSLHGVRCQSVVMKHGAAFVRCDEGFEGKVPVLHAKGRETKMTILPFGPSLMDEVLYLRPVIKGKGAPKAGFIIQEGEASYGT